MRIADLATRPLPGGVEIVATATEDAMADAQQVRFRFEGDIPPPPLRGDPFAVGFLVSAMFRREPLSVEAPVSPRLLEGLAKAQEILAAWHPYLRPVEVRPGSLAAPPGQGEAVVCCFSSGVDSWYSLLKHRERITHLLLVRGLDIGLGNDALWRQTRETVAEAAARFGLSVITAETNLRTLTDHGRFARGLRHRGDFWGEALHGSTLAAIGLLLQHMAERLILSSTHDYGHLIPWGSSPLLDPLWSTERLTVLHDGCEVTRVEKVRRIADCDFALARLRVCYNDTALYNCCRCGKCIRTMMALRIAKALGRARSFPEPLRLSQVRRLENTPSVQPRHEEILAAAQAAGDRDLASALQVLLGRRLHPERMLCLALRRVRGRWRRGSGLLRWPARPTERART